MASFLCGPSFPQQCNKIWYLYEYESCCDIGAEEVGKWAAKLCGGQRQGKEKQTPQA